MELVDEEDDLALSREDLVLDSLEAFFELAAKLRARDDLAHLQQQHAFVGERIGHFRVGDPLSESLDDDGLADSRLTDEHGVVLLAPQQDLDEPLDLLFASDNGIELRPCGPSP